MIKKLFLCIALLLVIGCASKPQLTVISSTGEPLPDPHYILDSLDKTIHVTFYYSAISGVKDLDNTVQPVPTFLDKNIINVLSFKKFKELLLTIKVFNPQKIPYTIYRSEAIKFRNGGNMDCVSIAGKSNLMFRTFKLELPFRQMITTAKVNFEIQGQGGTILIRTGKMEYSID